MSWFVTPQDQRVTAPTNAMADRNILGQWTYRVATRFQSYRRPGIDLDLWRKNQKWRIGQIRQSGWAFTGSSCAFCVHPRQMSGHRCGADLRLRNRNGRKVRAAVFGAFTAKGWKEPISTDAARQMKVCNPPGDSTKEGRFV